MDTTDDVPPDGAATPPFLAPDPLADEAPSRFALEVDAGGLGQALELFWRWLPKIQQTARAALWLEGVHLVVRFGPDEARVRARGVWPGVVTTPAAFLASIHEKLEPGGRIALEVADGRLALGPRIHVSCEVRPLGVPLPPFVELLEAPRLLDLVRIGLRHDAESLRLSGLEGAVREAREILDLVVDELPGILAERADSWEFSACEATEAIHHFVRRGLEQLDQPQEGGDRWRSVRRSAS